MEKAEFHQNRLKFHSDEALCEKDLSDYRLKFFDKIKSLLVEEKFENFKQLIQYPFPTTSIVDAIKDQYSKVFEAKDSFLEIDIKDVSKKAEFNQLLIELDEEGFWRKEAFDSLFGDVNSIIVLDRTKEDGKPYFFTVEIDDVHDISVKNNKIDYVIIEEEETVIKDGKEVELEYYIFIDQFRYVKYLEQESGNGIEYVFVDEVLHSLGETPANFIFHENLIGKDGIVKRSAITSVIGLLDEYLFKYTSKQYLDLYNAYPIYWQYTEDTDDDTEESILREDIMSMNGGVDLIASGGLGKIIENQKLRKKQKLLGPGTIKQIDAPSDNTEPDLREPFGFVSPDVPSLDYNVKEIDRLESKIYMKATGRPEQQQIADRPVNSQIQSQYEGERNVLLWVASQLSESRTWLMNCLVKMVTNNPKPNCICYFGTEYFIEDEASVIKNLNDYKNAGASQSQIWLRNKSLMQVSTKGKNSERDRLLMFEQLEPLYNLSLDKATELVQADLIEFKDFDLKVNFAERINKFEREYGSILSYEIGKSYNERINAIKSKLYQYGTTKKFNNGQGSTVGGANASVGMGKP